MLILKAKLKIKVKMRKTKFLCLLGLIWYISTDSRKTAFIFAISLNLSLQSQIFLSMCTHIHITHFFLFSQKHVYFWRECFTSLSVWEQKWSNAGSLQFHFHNRILLFWNDLFLNKEKCKELGTQTEVPSHQRLSIVSWITCDGWDLWIRICVKRFTTY